MKPLTIVYLHPTHIGKPISLKDLFPGEVPLVWLEDPRFLLHAASWLADVHGIRPWQPRHWGHDPAETGMRREWTQLDFGDRDRVVLCPGATSFRTAAGFAAARELPHRCVHAIPEGEAWRLSEIPGTLDDAFFFPVEIRDLTDPGELAGLVRDFPWPAALHGLAYGRPGTWFHVAADCPATTLPARSAGMMTDVPVELYGWYADPETGPVLHAVLAAIVEPGDLWECEAELASRLRRWAQDRPSQKDSPITARPGPRQLARQLEHYQQNLEPVAGVTLMRTVAADEPVAARLEELARWYNRVDDFEHAVGLVEAALRLEPDNLGLLTNRLRLRIAYNDWDRAAAELAAARATHDDFQLDLLAFRIAAGRGDNAGALAQGRALTSQLEKKGAARKLDRHARMDFLLTFAGVCLATAALDDGIDAVRDAVKLEPDHPGTYYLGALLLCGAMRWSDALDALKSAEACGNDASWTKFVEVLARVGCDQLDEAVKAAFVCEQRIADELETDGEYGPTLETRLLLAGYVKDDKLFRKTAKVLGDMEISPEFRFQVRLLCDLDPDYRSLPWPERCLDA
jgi:tetratricopeptide (TPR) repeat protein